MTMSGNNKAFAQVAALVVMVLATPVQAQEPKLGDVTIAPNWCAVREVGEWVAQPTRLGLDCAINDVSITVDCPHIASPTSVMARRIVATLDLTMNVCAGGESPMCDVTLSYEMQREADGVLRHRAELPFGARFTYLSTVLIRGESKKQDVLAVHYSWAGDAGPNCMTIFDRE